MKKVLCLSMAIMMALSVLSGCTKKTEATTQAATQAETQAQTAAAAALANPWIDTDYEGMRQATGLDLNVPDYAENVVYRVNQTENIAEIQFTIKETGVQCCARVKPTATAEDISGAYYTWSNEEEAKVDYCSGKIGSATTNDGAVQYCTWFDAVPGISYSLVASAKDLDGFDITAVAADVFKPMQGDAG